MSGQMEAAENTVNILTGVVDVNQAQDGAAMHVIGDRPRFIGLFCEKTVVSPMLQAESAAL